MAPRAPGAPGRTRLGGSDPAALSRVVDLLGLAGRRGKSGPAWAWSRWDCTRRRPGCSLESMAGRGQLPGYLSQPSWVSVGTREAVTAEVFLLFFCFVGLNPRCLLLEAISYLFPFWKLSSQLPYKLLRTVSRQPLKRVLSRC